MSFEPLCIVGGELEVYNPHSACLPNVYPRMLKACSEMGTTLYNLQWSSTPYEERAREGAVKDPSTAAEALVLPVTLRMQSPWHALHSLVPAYAMVALDERYRL